MNEVKIDLGACRDLVVTRFTDPRGKSKIDIRMHFQMPDGTTKPASGLWIYEGFVEQLISALLAVRAVSK